MPSGGADSWWRSAAIYQLYVRSFADGDGDGIGDLAGRAGVPRRTWPRSASTRSGSTRWYPSPMSDAGYDISDYRVDRSGLRHARRRRHADRRGARARASGSSSTWCPTTPPTGIPGSPPRWPPGRGRPSGTGSGSGRAAGSSGDDAAEQLAVDLRRARLDPGRRAGRLARRVVPAPVRAASSRTSTGAIRGRPARLRGRAAVLVRPRRRRHQDRLGRAAVQGRRLARGLR